MASTERVLGTITAFARGYGFIRATGSSDDIFVHGSAIVVPEGQSVAQPRIGSKVSFVLQRDPKDGRFRAVDVRTPDGRPIDGRPAETVRKEQRDATRVPAGKTAPQPRPGSARLPNAVTGRETSGVVSGWRGGFGFINGDDGVRYFVPSSELRMADGERRPFTLSEGQAVVFTPEESERGPVATAVSGPQRTGLRNGTHRFAKPAPAHVAERAEAKALREAARLAARRRYDGGDSDDDEYDDIQDDIEGRLHSASGTVRY